ncbi:phosphoenolpyruvate--protein phosphotransferase [Aestuariirhabdus litorea]|uniref:phosphoenolpyruvate--protein phosphotransferase n=1 Tax=Aestuariirhabdus litorea TaxID=2528527 RepID=A0A3P3VN09_9GAMM|nr:phosphoenolpyruvate--protein phosphotransferase [Aestuariirhabdus litorea]RRJ83089.1 phosphoenolpyruvate-protein phosphotransferase PtsP [Aestuariirhabdus litorea]RWW93246.1 phosphoenolpyruvate--protein phosphotransferase [Endozoicomonadaceae bacterium GTF-13]
MLNVLRVIVQKVNAAKDLQAALEIIVHEVRVAMKTEVCSVFLYDNDENCYTLMASEGLNQSAIGMKLLRSEGLVGQVGLREEPINLQDAASHPKYRYLKESGEERFHAFLGVPIIHHRAILGVLVVQQQEVRFFDETEESFLVTMSAQLAAVIAHAEASGSLTRQETGRATKDTRFAGVAGAPGVAIGEAVVLSPPAYLSAVPDRPAEDIKLEVKRLRRALKAVRKDLKHTAKKLAASLPPEEIALFDVYRGMLDDNAIGAEVRTIIEQGQWAQGALRQVIEEHVKTFEMMEDPYLSERATDVRDLGRRVLSHLQQDDNVEEVVYPDQCVLIAEELTPAMLGEVPRDKLVGMVSVKGSGNSHVAILARAMGVPTVMGAVDLPFTRISGIELIIDGNLGRVYPSPSVELRGYYQEVVDQEREFVAGLEVLRDKPCITTDETRVSLWVNTGLMTDVARSLDRGAEGVGLYRTEVPFMIRERFPSEKEQQEIYREQLQAFAPFPVTMRTLDIGGDKALSYFPIKEDNPFLGWRGIRVTLDHPEIFLVQVRAMIKASLGLNNLRIMLPMVCNVAEVEEALHLIHRAHGEVVSEGMDVKLPPVGVMIEVPAAVYLVRDFARRVDFLSIGTNDLTQYLLAVDRNNPRVAELYHSFHPAVLAALGSIVRDAHAEGAAVSICGEMAGDPAAAVLLVAMGYDVLSMNATNLPRIKWVLRNISAQWARELLEKVVTMDNAFVIQSTMELEMRKAGLGKVMVSARASQD